MIRTPRTSTVVSLLILGTGTAHAEILNVSMVAQDHSPLSLSFDLNTAATTDAFSVGSCGSGEASGVYTNFSATGGISNASLLWDGVSYSLQSSNIFLDNQSSCDYDLDMRLTFNTKTTFTVPSRSAAVRAATETPGWWQFQPRSVAPRAPRDDCAVGNLGGHRVMVGLVQAA